LIIVLRQVIPKRLATVGGCFGVLRIRLEPQTQK